MSALLRRLLGFYRCPICGDWTRSLPAHVWVDHAGWGGGAR